jgi:ABC-type bacteriocin/lantibiotic exporter with double-glycine peptidase domain
MDRKDVCFAGILTGMGTLLALFPLFAIQWLFDHIFDHAYHSLLWLIALGLIATALSSAFFLYLRHLMLLRLSGEFGCQFQTALWQRLFQLPRGKMPLMIREKLENVEQVKEHLFHYGPKVLGTTFFSFLYLGAMAFFSVPMTVIALGVIGIDLLIFCSLVRKKNALRKQISHRQAHRGALLTQSLCVLERVRASGAEGRFFKMWADQSSQINALKQTLETLCSTLISLQLFVPLCILVLLLAALDLGWISSSRGSFFAFYLAMINFCLALREGIGSSLQEPSFEKEPATLSPIAEKITLKGGISVEGVTDEHGNKMSFTLLPGEKIHIAASSDRWTTQLVRYLLGFEEPIAGKICFDGMELQHLDLSHLRSQIGTVFRTKGVFVGTIRENLVVGRNCSESDLEEALSLSGFDEDLKSFRMGYDTLLPEGGATLSTGQKQRLLLARALCCRPAILILDQGIDALDPVSKQFVLDHLKGLPCTQILISQ